MAADLFDTDNLESILNQLVLGKSEIKLSEFLIPTFEVPEDFAKFICHFEKDIHGTQIRNAIEPIAKEAEEQGYSDNIFTAIYEAVLNAYQHGNNYDPNKSIRVDYKITNQQLEIAITDQGGIIKSEFIPFVLRHREGKHKTKFLDFYEFTKTKKPVTNNGTGTSFIHTYVDEVSYFKSKEGGLVVYLLKKK